MAGPRAIDDYPQTMTSAEVCELLLIPNVQLVQRMAREGRIPAHREPGAHLWWFDRDELIEWMRSETKVIPD